MSSEDFETSLARRHPTEADAIQRLVARVRSAGPKTRWELTRLVGLVKPEDVTELAIILSEFVRRGLLKREVGVRSPATRKIAFVFPRRTDIPPEIEDPVAGSFVPEEDDIEVFYRVRPGASERL